MSDNLMTPEQFGEALDVLLAASKALATLPLTEMTDYIDRVEELGEDNPAFTPERVEVTSYAGRIIAAASHLRSTLQMGGVR